MRVLEKISGYYTKQYGRWNFSCTPAARRIYNVAKLSRNTSTNASNGLYEPNESFSSLTERKILTIDPIDFDVRHSDERTDGQAGGRAGGRADAKRGREMDVLKERCSRLRPRARCIAVLLHIASFTFA